VVVMSMSGSNTKSEFKMQLHVSKSLPKVGALCGILLSSLMACSVPEGGAGINDPYETQNRRFHEFNKTLDRALVRPASNAYGSGVPEPIRQGVSNFSSNASLPGKVVNATLQGDIDGVVQNTLRFLTNSTFGLLGILDVAGEGGLREQDTDFGETLAVWGIREGAYQDLPFLGPSTERDTVGRIVDLFTNPLSHFIERPASYFPPVANVASRFGDRYTFGDSIDSIFYESADSYAQTRLFYLQSRRFQLGESASSELIDPYEDPYDELFEQ